MARNILVEVLGADRLASTLNRAASDLGDLGDTAAEVAESVASDARSRAPYVSGTLSRSIQVGMRRKNEARVVAGAIYAGVIEFGWPRRNIAAQPYLRPAVDAAETKVLTAYAKGVGKTLAKVRGA